MQPLTRKAPYYYPDDDRITVAPVATHRASARAVAQRTTHQYERQRTMQHTTENLNLRRPQPPTYDVDEEDVDGRYAERPSAYAARPVRRSPAPTKLTRKVPSTHVQRGKVLTLWGMTALFAVIVAWSLLVHVYVWYMNTVSNPLTYTQMAHQDGAVLVDGKSQDEVHAFLDQQHIDLIIVPNGDISKAHIVQGPAISPANDQVVRVAVHGTSITVQVQGPLEASLFAASQSVIQWTTDVTGK